MSERPLDVVLSRLEGVRLSGRGYSARCPAHDDRAPSLSVAEGNGGRVLVKCHKGCPAESVVAAAGLSMSDLFTSKAETNRKSPRETRRRYALGRIVRTYDYFDAEGVLRYQVVRFEPKDFRQRRPDGSGGWRWGLGTTEQVLFRLPEVIEAVRAGRVVFVVEGEKDVEALEAWGLVSTCNPMGAGKWREAYADALRGARVVVLPDADETGERHTRDIARSLYGIAEEVRIVRLPGLADKGDASDWIEQGGTPEELKALVREAPLYEPTEDEADAVDDVPVPIGVRVSDVEREAVRWLWPGRLALGKLTIIDGDPGLGKSTLYCDLAARLTRGTEWPDGEPVETSAGAVIVTTEDGIGDTIRPRLEEAGANLDRVSVVQLIPEEEGPGRVPVLPDDAELLLGECERIGASLLVIDPLMAHLAAETNSYRDQDVRRAMAPLSEAAERHGVAIAVLRHLNKATGGSAIYRGGGSIGIIGAARVGLMVGRDPDDEGRVVLACSKNNIAARPDSLAFRLVSSDRDPGTAVLRWEGVSPLSAEDLCRPPAKGTARDDAADWLEAFLDDGPRASADVFGAGKAAGHSEKTLYRAKDELGIEVRKRGFNGGWEWALPRTLGRASEPNSPKMAIPVSDHLGESSSDGVGTMGDPWDAEPALGEGLEVPG